MKRIDTWLKLMCHSNLNQARLWFLLRVFFDAAAAFAAVCYCESTVKPTKFLQLCLQTNQCRLFVQESHGTAFFTLSRNWVNYELRWQECGVEILNKYFWLLPNNNRKRLYVSHQDLRVKERKKNLQPRNGKKKWSNFDSLLLLLFFRSVRHKEHRKLNSRLIFGHYTYFFLFALAKSFKMQSKYLHAIVNVGNGENV